MEEILSETQEKLIKEIENERKTIKTDNYDMSIGELINLYKDGELNLKPAYQRLFRWRIEQKTRFIESILIGIPIPSIFVAQQKDGKWDVVDGVQRISTILQFTNELRDEDEFKNNHELEYDDESDEEDELDIKSDIHIESNSESHKHLELIKGKLLTSLDNITWDTLPSNIKRVIKRAKIGVNIILTENSIKAQYELFQRLNTGGTKLSDQEVRNCLLIMIDKNFYNKINELKEYESFKKSVKITKDKQKEEYLMELIVRYMVGKSGDIDYSNYNTNKNSFSYFIDEEITNLLGNTKFQLDKEIQIFKSTFDYIYNSMGDIAFRKYYESELKFKGSFYNSAFEAITIGVSENIDKISKLSTETFKEYIKSIYSQEDFLIGSKRGTKAIVRFQKLTQFSKAYFSEINEKNE